MKEKGKRRKNWHTVSYIWISTSYM